VQSGTGKVLAMAVNRHYELSGSATVAPLVSGGNGVPGYPTGSTFTLFTMLAVHDASALQHEGRHPPHPADPAHGTHTNGGRSGWRVVPEGGPASTTRSTAEPPPVPGDRRSPVTSASRGGPLRGAEQGGGWQAGPMLLEHRGWAPQVDPSAYVAPTAVLCGRVVVGPDARVLFGAVLTAEDGQVSVGARCVVMENALLRGRAAHPVRIGEDVLVGPHAHINGARVEDGWFPGHRRNPVPRRPARRWHRGPGAPGRARQQRAAAGLGRPDRLGRRRRPSHGPATGPAPADLVDPRTA
jgi:hypothetical protein